MIRLRLRSLFVGLPLSCIGIVAAGCPAGVIGGGVAVAVAGGGGGGGSAPNGSDLSGRGTFAFDTQPPSSVVVGETLSTVSVTIDAPSLGDVTIYLDSSPWALSGEVTLTPTVGGSAEFDDLKVEASGHYRLVAEYGGLTIRSAPFDVIPHVETTGPANVQSVPLGGTWGSLSFNKSVDSTRLTIEAEGFEAAYAFGPYIYQIRVDGITKHQQSYDLQSVAGEFAIATSVDNVSVGVHSVEIIYVQGDNGSGNTSGILHSLRVTEDAP